MAINKSGVYLLPNILTTFGLFAGFYSIVSAINSNFVTSAVAIFVAMLWDGLDGRLARMTGTNSSFGEQYDSMADLLSFGIAPAFLIYFYTVEMLSANFGKFTIIALFIYIAGTSLRLARFNAQINNIDKEYFQGLPSPSAAALIASSVLLHNNLQKNNIICYDIVAFILLLLLIVAGILMVSNIRYYSFKSINLKNKSSFKKLLIPVIIIVLIFVYPSIFLFIFALTYAISGIVITLVKIHKKRKNKSIVHKK